MRRWLTRVVSQARWLRRTVHEAVRLTKEAYADDKSLSEAARDAERHRVETLADRLDTDHESE